MKARNEVLNGESGLMSDTAMLTDDVLELDDEHVEELGEDDTIHLSQARKSRGNSVRGDMFVERVALQHQQDAVGRSGWRGGRGRRGLDVLDTSSLCVETRDYGDLECVGGVGDEGHGRGSHKVLFGGGEVTLKSIYNGLRLLPHEGSLLVALMDDGDSRLDNDEVRCVGGVGHSDVAQSYNIVRWVGQTNWRGCRMEARGG
jgi:hypothetical protein